MNAAPDPYDFGEPVYKYTRAQAIDDGVLADLSRLFPERVERAGVRVHVAMTSTAFAAAVGPLDAPAEWEALAKAGEDIDARASRVLAAYVQSFRRRAARLKSDRMDFAVTVLHAPNDWREVDLVAHAGPGDQGEPVLTIMLPGED